MTMAGQPFLGKGLPDSDRGALIRSGAFDRDLFQAVYSKDWRRQYTPAEIERMKLLETREIGSGWSYRGNLWNFYNFLRNRALDEYWERQFRTGQNLTDPLGTAGYGIGLATGSDPDQASDVGATLGSVITAGATGPRYSPPEPTYQRNPPAQTVGARGVIEPNPVIEPPNSTKFVVTPSPSNATANNLPPPPSAPVSSGRPQASQRANQNLVTPPLGSRDVDNRIEAPTSPGSSQSRVPVSPRTGEPDPLGVKKTTAPAAPQSTQPSQRDIPPRKPTRFNARDVLPLKPKALAKATVSHVPKTETQKTAEGRKESKPAAAAAKLPATKPGSKERRTERTPSPREVEKGTIEAIDRDAPALPTGSQVVSRGENFNTISDRLKTLREAAPNSPNLKPIDGMKPEVLEDSAWQLMDRLTSSGRPELKDSYTRLYNLAKKRAERGEPSLKEELDDFMISGRLGTRKPDSVVLVDEGTALNFVLTDPNVKEQPVALMVHDFKSLFYREGMRALFGNSQNVKVESWEHNPKLGIHREAQGVSKLPRY
jgi:hypothetical protein